MSPVLFVACKVSRLHVVTYAPCFYKIQKLTARSDHDSTSSQMGTIP